MVGYVTEKETKERKCGRWVVNLGFEGVSEELRERDV